MLISNGTLFRKETTSCTNIMNTKKPNDYKKMKYAQKYSNFSKSTMVLLLVKPHAQDQLNKDLMSNDFN